MAQYYIVVQQIDQQRLYAANPAQPTPRVVARGVHTWILVFMAPRRGLPVPLPTLVCQPLIDSVPYGAGYVIARWPIQITVDMGDVPDGVHVLGVQVLGQDRALYSPWYTQVIVSRSTARQPVLPFMVAANIQREGAEPDWLPALPLPPAAAPRAFAVPQPYTIALDSTRLWADHIVQESGYLYEPRYEVFQDANGNNVVLPFIPERGEHWLEVAPFLDRLPLRDGKRGVGYVSPYITAAVCERDQSSICFVESALSRARFGRISADGTVETIVGYRLREGATPCNPYDLSIPESVRAGAYERVGDADGGDMRAPLDCQQDPRHHELWYVCDSGNHRIVVINEVTGMLRTYAGVPSISGYEDGEAARALFATPTSLTLAADGTMYIADWGNHRIRVIAPDGQTVSTLLGQAQGAAPRDNQLTLVSADVARSTWMQDGAAGEARLLYPFCVRLDSEGRLLIGEPWFATLRRFDGVSLTEVWRNVVAQRSRWQWFDVDKEGTCGPENDVFFVAGTGGGDNMVVLRLSADFSRETQFRGGSHHFDCRVSQAAMVHYPWLVCVGYGAIWLTGYGQHGVVRWRALGASDPPPVSIAEQGLLVQGLQAYRQVSSAYAAGVSPQPGYSLLHGPYGMAALVGPTFAEMARLSDGDLAQVLQSGWGGVTRPQVSPSDLRALRVFFARYAGA